MPKYKGISEKLGEIVRESAGTIRGRLHYHGISIRKSPWADVLSIFTTQTLTKHRKALERLGRELGREGDTTTIRKRNEALPNQRKPDAQEVDVDRALAALMRANRAVGPLTVGELSSNEVASALADAIRFLGGVPEKKNSTNTVAREVNIPFTLTALMRVDRSLGPLSIAEFVANPTAVAIADAIRYLGGLPKHRNSKTVK